MVKGLDFSYHWRFFLRLCLEKKKKVVLEMASYGKLAEQGGNSTAAWTLGCKRIKCLYVQRQRSCHERVQSH